MTEVSLAPGGHSVVGEETRPTNRFERACDVAESARITPLGEGMFHVQGSRRVPYLVSLGEGVCSCGDYQHNIATGKVDTPYCKHLVMLGLRALRGTLPRPRREAVARVVKLPDGESLRGVLTSPEALDALAERWGV